MKKIISVFLVICSVLFTSNLVFLTDKKNIDKKDGVDWNLYSISDFSSGLLSENVDVENSEAYDICMLIETKDLLPENTFDASNIFLDSSNVDVLLKEHRTNVKNYYSTYNGDIASILGLDKYTYYTSYYSPYIEIVFDDLAEYEKCEKDIISAIKDSENLLSSVSTYATFDMVPEATVDSDSYNTLYPIANAFNDIEVTNAPYTGNGVKIGILDYNIPHITNNLTSGKYTMLSAPRTDNHDHGTIVASIAGGTTGIANNAHLYCLITTGNLIADSNLLIDTYDVNIINMSLGVNRLGYYTEADSCVDIIVSLSGCTFVKSAGNQNMAATTKDYYISGFGYSLNAITVGAINGSHNLVASSCWNTVDDFVYKPDVVAPGGWLSGIPNLPNGLTGTSCAAPMVTGTIALLMEEFPALKTNPTLVKSILHLGAEKLPSQTNYFDQQAGFGLINYQNMRECLLNSRFSNFFLPSNVSAGAIVLSQTITIPALSEINIHANLITYSSYPEETSERTTPTFTDYAIKIYDPISMAYISTSIFNSTVDYLSYTNGTTSDKQIRVDIILESENASGLVEFGSMTYEIVDHIHVYDGYVYLNKLSHRAVCDCGATGTIGAHYTNSGDVDGDGYAPCSACGYLMDLRDDGSEGLMSIPQVSVNGSYILPNGIVVLVDEDVEAYLAGTLQFYHPADLPVTE